ncbi:hypothetical protein DFR60_10273 [Hungatella effluvii]|uniref:Uncharacterized protein n=1 Tax=Hungatella effluvii TaxID=1096246 RepID=A0A2V3YBZ4_9FIRM|nr:hypothetical protein [Hungatella effluvii]PXX55799.1 hypothetical protein DFR60_10273 [Hungatella effluvii]
MKCNNCGGKMVKWKYLDYEEMETYLLSEEKQSASAGTYEEWLRSLHADELVLTSLKRIDFSGEKEKYYVRVVEKTTKNGIKLKHLTKIFRYGTGEVRYEGKSRFAPTAIYKILPIDETIGKVIRNYCKDDVNFDIDV